MYVRSHLDYNSVKETACKVRRQDKGREKNIVYGPQGSIACWVVFAKIIHESRKFDSRIQHEWHESTIIILCHLTACMMRYDMIVEFVAD